MSINCILMNQSGGGNGNSLHYSNVVIAANDFVEYTTTLGTEEEKLYNLGYTYKANVAITDCLEVMIPEATLSLPEIESSGVEVASQINCYNGGVTFYANGAPANDITILTIELSWSDEIVDVEGILTPADIGAIPASEKGVAGGVATLGSDGLIPAAQLPSMDYIPTSEKGVASGVATLDESGKVSEAQLPAIGGAVESVNGKVGVVELTADDVNAAPAIQSGTEELVDGTSELPYGVLYCLIEE